METDMGFANHRSEPHRLIPRRLNLPPLIGLVLVVLMSTLFYGTILVWMFGS
jgi:hypothetical protein